MKNRGVLDIFNDLERCIEMCDPYLAHLLKEFRRKNPTYPPCREDVMRAYLDGHFAQFVITLIDPQKHGLSGQEAAVMLKKLLEAKECAIKAMLP